MKYTKLFRIKSYSNEITETSEGEQGLKRDLSLRDLTSFGIAAIIGAGIFGTIGNASAAGGPAITLLFIFTAVACLFSALCYAQFASRIPVAGSAYTYAYASFGELIAWIIGWDLLMEYAIGNIAVAISWSDYFTSFLKGFNIHLPDYFTMDFLSASRGYEEVMQKINSGQQLSSQTPFLQDSYHAWERAPMLGNLKVIIDLPALLIIVIVTMLVYVGIKSSKNSSNILVLIKLAIIFMIIVVGAFYVNPLNWTPFAPNGVGGVMKGLSAVFFAYIGFDAISTTAEECKNPKRDLPKAMLYSLLICTILYVLITLILTGMSSYKELAIGDPLAYVFEKAGLNFLSGVISLSAIVALTSGILVFQMGQPRIWMSMSRDGLLPKIFSRIHPKYKTPSFSTILTGFVVAVPAMFMNLTEVTDLCSIGTLFAFVLVCGGVLIVGEDKPVGTKTFKVPYYNGKYLVPAIIILTIASVYILNKDGLIDFFNYKEWDSFQHKLPLLFFAVVALLLTYFTFMKNLSLIPVLGLLVNLYLMSQLGITNWLRFLIWLVLGLVIYFLYSYRNSKLNNSR